MNYYCLLVKQKITDCNKGLKCGQFKTFLCLKKKVHSSLEVTLWVKKNQYFLDSP